MYLILLFFFSSTTKIVKIHFQTAFYLSTVPGGGQLYNGKLLKASLVLALESYAIFSWLENAKIYIDYDSMDKPLPKNRYLEKRNKYAWWVIFIYFYGMIDAMVDAHLSPFDQIMNTTIDDETEAHIRVYH